MRRTASAWLQPSGPGALGMQPPQIETHRRRPPPQLLADRFGWREMAEKVAAIHRALPPAERATAGVSGQNYG